MSCSKEDDYTVQDRSNIAKGIKVTLSTSGTYSKEEGSSIGLHLWAKDKSDNPQPWTVNGKAIKATNYFYDFNSDFFEASKTLVAQSPTQFTSAAVIISASADVKPFKIIYKVEEGGKVVDQGELDIKEKSSINKVFDF